MPARLTPWPEKTWSRSSRFLLARIEIPNHSYTYFFVPILSSIGHEQMDFSQWQLHSLAIILPECIPAAFRLWQAWPSGRWRNCVISIPKPLAWTTRSGTRSRLKRAIYSRKCTSCIRTGPLGPAVIEFWFSTTGQPVAVVMVSRLDRHLLLSLLNDCQTTAVADMKDTRPAKMIYIFN